MTSGAERMRQVHDPAGDRRPDRAGQGTHPPGRPRPHPACGAQSQARHGLPELRALLAPDGRREHRLRPRRPPARGTDGEGRAAARPRPAPGLRRPLPAEPFGRPAAARRRGARARPRSGGAPDGRALRRARPRAALRAAGGTGPHAGERRRHHRHGHPRPGRGAGGRRAARRDERGPRRAGRLSRGDLRQPREPVRERLHRPRQPDPGDGDRARRRSRRRTAPRSPSGGR